MSLDPLPGNPYRVASTSRNTADVNDIVLSETGTTRSLLRSTIVRNPNNEAAGVRLTLMHQRKGRNDVWEDPDEPPLSNVKAGEIRIFNLRSEPTLRLHQALVDLYAIHNNLGVTRGIQDLVVAHPSEVIRAPEEIVNAINTLINNGHAEGLWDVLGTLDQDTLDAFSSNVIQAKRKLALELFANMLRANHTEQEWEDFFKVNRWIFGYGLDYQFLSNLQDQPNYGGANITGVGAQRGDQLHTTSGSVKYTVLVEIKRPDTSLLARVRYRNGAYSISEELAGGIAQIQSCCHLWEVEGSRTDANRELLGEVRTVKPKGILVIGKSSELIDRQRAESFELFRSHLQGIAILTYDELFERASFIVNNS
jgi:hypothetical protein